MAKLACMTLPYASFPFERALAGIARTGYKYVAFGLAHAGEEVPDENDERAVSKLEKLFGRYSLQPIMLIGNRQLAPGRPAERVRNYLRTAKALGIEEVLSVGTFGYRQFPDEPLSAEEMEAKNRAFAEQFRMVAEEAEALDLVITLKPHTGNTATAEHLIETLERIGSERVKVSYDPGNVQYYEGIAADADFLKVADKTYSIIAKDHRGARANIDFPVPGTGDVNFLAIFKAWKEAGRDGSVVVERIDGPNEPESIDQRFAEARIRVERLLQEAGFVLA